MHELCESTLQEYIIKLLRVVQEEKLNLWILSRPAELVKFHRRRNGRVELALALFNLMGHTHSNTTDIPHIPKWELEEASYKKNVTPTSSSGK